MIVKKGSGKYAILSLFDLNRYAIFSQSLSIDYGRKGIGENIGRLTCRYHYNFFKTEKRKTLKNLA